MVVSGWGSPSWAMRFRSHYKRTFVPARLTAPEAVALFVFLTDLCVVIVSCLSVVIYAGLWADWHLGTGLVMFERAFEMGDAGAARAVWPFLWTVVIASATGSGWLLLRWRKGPELVTGYSGYAVGPENGLTLSREISFQDKKGNLWSVPKGTVCRGGALPGAVIALLGQPLQGPYRNAAIVYEYYHRLGTASESELRRMFYEACRAEGMSGRKAKQVRLALQCGA